MLLDLLTLVNSTDPPAQMSDDLLRGIEERRLGEHHANNYGSDEPWISPELANDPCLVFPLTFHYNGRAGSTITLYAESAQDRDNWKVKIEKAILMRKI